MPKKLALIFFFLLAVADVFAVNVSEDTTSYKRKAEALFIEGKTLELKNNYLGAIENYKTALQFDKAPGIYYALGNLCYYLGKYQDALMYIKKALDVSPNETEYLERLSSVYIALDDFPKATETIEKIINIDTSYTYGLYTLARLYQEMKMPSKAITVYESITDKIGYDYEVLRKMYDIYVGFKEMDKATETLEAILKLNPFNSEIKALLAAHYREIGRLEEAERLYEEVFALSPKDKNIQAELIKIYFQKNDNTKGFEKFSQLLGKDSLDFYEKVQVGEVYYRLINNDKGALDISTNIFTGLNNDYPGEWIPYYYLGAIDLIMKNEDSYQAKFDKAMQYGDTSRQVYLLVGISYFQRNKMAEAKTALEKGLVQFPEDFDFLNLLGNIEQTLGNSSNALMYYEKAREQNPDDVNNLVALAGLYETFKRYKESNAAYEKVLSIEPDNALALNNYAYYLSVRGERLNEALAMSKKSLENNADNGSYLDTYGWILFKLKKYEDARDYILKSLKANPNSAVVNDHLGDVYDALGDRTNAMKYWKKAYELAPDNIEFKNKVSK
jgi:tetratricopeptide (TPR) repeat protein